MIHILKRRNFFVLGKTNYTCKHCGNVVEGGRYNNHCPKCLWSRHVDDILPGDRLSKCKNMMKPIDVLQKHGKWRIIQKCEKCHKIFTVDSSDNDNLDEILKLSQNPISNNKRGE